MTHQDEVNILSSIAEGLTAKEMSDKIGVPVRTINFRLQVLYEKHNLPPGKNRFIKLLKATGYIRKDPT